MSLPPIISAGFKTTPENGKGPLSVVFTDGSAGYDAIEQAGDSDNTIIQTGSRTDYIRQE